MVGSECLLHATTVALAGRAALIRGASGSGKSDLALRFISDFASDGAALISDDQTSISLIDDQLIVRAPATIAGLIEVRGIGPLCVPCRDHATLVLVVDLVKSSAVPRLQPDPPPQEQILGRQVPLTVLAPFEASAPLKLKLLLDGNLLSG